MKNGTKIFTAILLALNAVHVCAVASETRTTETTPVSVDKTPTKSSTATLITVSGKVTDTSGTPLPGITIQVAYQNGELANNSTITDKNGLFSLNRVPSDTGLLVGGSTYEQKWVHTAANMNIRLDGYSADEVFVSCPSNAEWSDTEKHCVCKDTSKQYINGVCVDKPQRTSSLQAPQELPEKTESIPEALCKNKGNGYFWDTATSECRYVGDIDFADSDELIQNTDEIDVGEDVSHPTTISPKRTPSSVTVPALETNSTQDEQTVIAELNVAIANGVKIGDRIQIDKSIRYAPDIEKLVNKWEKACERALKPAHAKTSFAFVVNHLDLIRECKIKDCEKGYEVSENGLSCETESDKIKACERKGGEYSAGSCWCKTMIMNPSKAECIDGKIVKDKQSNNTNNGNSGTQEYDNSQTSENEADPERLEKLRQAYDDARETEQSEKNRLLTGVTTAATGLGAMELAQGLSEQRADNKAQQSMNAYIATMRCKYAGGKSVKAGEEIELPGGNALQYRAEYIALANDLKERKEALGMKPGIESEEILDSSQMGLYDDENVGVTDGEYSSLYRARALNSDQDNQQIEEASKSSRNRVIGGAVAGGAGAVGGALGNSLINGELHELIQSKKDK